MDDFSISSTHKGRFLWKDTRLEIHFLIDLPQTKDETDFDSWIDHNEHFLLQPKAVHLVAGRLLFQMHRHQGLYPYKNCGRIDWLAIKSSINAEYRFLGGDASWQSAVLPLWQSVR